MDRGRATSSQREHRRVRPAVRAVCFALALGGICLQSGAAPKDDEIALGREIFHAIWSPRESHGKFSGLGPHFQAASCIACHQASPGPLYSSQGHTAPSTLVMQLESPAVAVTAELGDPVYGRILSTSAVGGIKPEGTVLVTYEETYGYYYPDGTRWRLRTPTYKLLNLAHGPLAPTTVIKPRMPPSLFGIGSLEAAFSSQSVGAGDRRGLFGWQESTVSIREQSARALAFEMGITSDTLSKDDCTVAEPECQPDAGAVRPDISSDQLNSLVEFVRTLTVPASPYRHADTSFGGALFASIGCAVCHRSSVLNAGEIRAYTDMQLHDLGAQMADRNAAGKRVASKWRTAPLWGLGARIGTDGQATLLHDGRARSAEEAILWHDGEASHARARWLDLGPRSRRALLHFLETL
jgi:CxxC motif-containing protein (DUF1111 family)